MTGSVGATDHGADRRPDHNVGNEAVRQQGADDADMGEAARRAAAQSKPDHRLANRPQPNLATLVSAVLAASNQHFQHYTSPGILGLLGNSCPGYTRHLQQSRPQVLFFSL